MQRIKAPVSKAAKRKAKAKAPVPARKARVAGGDTVKAPERAPLMIVGIGASAGGLEAFKNFFAPMPVDSGMAFVLMQHLAPQHTSLLAELIGRSTAMPVTEAADGEPVLANMSM